MCDRCQDIESRYPGVRAYHKGNGIEVVARAWSLLKRGVVVEPVVDEELEEWV